MSIIKLPESLGGNPDSYAKIVSDCRAIQSDESLKTGLCNVTDLFIRTGNVLKVTLTRFNQSVKRGELEKYCNDHATLVHSIEGLNYFDIRNMTVDIPMGMATPYPQTVKNLSEAFGLLKIEDTLAGMLKEFKHVREQVLNQEDASQAVHVLHGLTAALETPLANATKLRNASFDSRTHAFTFGKSFASMEEFRRTRINCIETEKHLYHMDRIDELYTDISGVVSDITVVRDVHVGKPVADMMSQSALVTAKALDLYGTCSLDLMAVSHNMTIVLNKLYQVVK